MPTRRHLSKDAPKFPPHAQDIFTVPQYLSAGSVQIPGDDIHHGAFACAIGPQKAVKARAESETHSGQGFSTCLLVVVYLSKVVEFYLSLHIRHRISP